MIYSTLDQQNQTMSQIMMKMTKNQAQQRLYHQRTLNKVSQGAFDQGVKLYDDQPPNATSYSGPMYGAVDLSPLANLTSEGFKGVNIVDQEQDYLLQKILSKVVNLTRKFDNFTGLESMENYEAEVANLTLESDILTADQAQSLVNLLPEGATLTKAFQASQNGWTHSDFHSIVDGNGPTLTVIKNGYNKTFGGFTDISWQSNDGGYQTGNGTTFQFFYQGDEAVKIPSQNSGSEIYFRNDLLMSFAEGIWIYNNCNTDYQSNVDFGGNYYEWPTGASTTQQAGLIVAGSDNSWPTYQCVEIETWYV